MSDTGPPRDGATFDPALDGERADTQQERVLTVMRCGQWLTVSEIQARIALMFNGKLDPETSIGTRVRDLRKAKFGLFRVDAQRRGNPKAGLWEYRLVVPPQTSTESVPPLEA
ncbi:hypothetical protein VT84_37170 [Gemmata sp. SH-PL17]|uniref:hypothetical protein n=1 Tax=Gemmata sp. SH-PL17 TaxID=1630693 RepID=UPI00078E76A5|nr:hypothetical protein [Gemmata sp. SH-PL17]AMV30085.1 hypothetical protein VT84_37170 [Gemmata sp. SH-PL17]